MMTELIVMRLADMERMHPNQIVSKCATCGHDVAIFPSGQLVLQRWSNVTVTCSVCKSPGSSAKLAPGANVEPFETVKKQ